MRDSDVRAAVATALGERYAGDPSTRIVQEMGVWSGTVRIDIAVINGELSGYELKSDRDTLERLPQQVELYSRVFDKVTLVVGRKHAAKAVSTIPKWWGVTVATMKDGRVELRARRQPKQNRTIDSYLVAQLLWKDEALAVLESHALARGWRSRRIHEIHERLAYRLTPSDLAREVRQKLKLRPTTAKAIGAQLETSGD